MFGSNMEEQHKDEDEATLADRIPVDGALFYNLATSASAACCTMGSR
jgi:hypothetical protein